MGCLLIDGSGNFLVDGSGNNLVTDYPCNVQMPFLMMVIGLVSSEW